MITKKIYFLIFSIFLIAASVQALPLTTDGTVGLVFDTDAATCTLLTDPCNVVTAGVVSNTGYGAEKVTFTFDSIFIATADPCGVTITGSRALNLVATTGDITIEGVLDVSGTVGYSADPNWGSVNGKGIAGSGGWDGGMSGAIFDEVVPIGTEAEMEDLMGGQGPGGSAGGGAGAPGGAYASEAGSGSNERDLGQPYGNEEMFILIGGSGGSGGGANGGGGGGGCIGLEALLGDIIIGATGAIIADGGTVVGPNPELYYPADDEYCGEPGWGDPCDPEAAIDPDIPLAFYGSFPNRWESTHVFPYPPFSHIGGDVRYTGGGGAGGGIRLVAGAGTVTVHATAVLSANGGQGGDNIMKKWNPGKDWTCGGGGSGGRIAIYTQLDDATLDGSVTADGGDHGTLLDPDGLQVGGLNDGEWGVARDDDEGWEDQTDGLIEGPAEDGTSTEYAGTVPPVALEPTPDNEAEDVSVFADLAWTAHVDATVQDVNVLLDGSSIATHNDATGTLEIATNAQAGGPFLGNTTYEWQVVTNNPGGVGLVWEFTTGSAIATVPIPCDYNAGPVTELRWTPVDGAASYNVYYSNDYGDLGTLNNVAQSDDPCLLAITVVDGEQNWWRVDTVGPFSDVITGDVWTFMPQANLDLKINFQPDPIESWMEDPEDEDEEIDVIVPAPVGYQLDTGELIDDRGNGYTYGWQEDEWADEGLSGEAFYVDGEDGGGVGENGDVRYDTAIWAGYKDDPDEDEYPIPWIIELPAGTYSVSLTMGESGGKHLSQAIISGGISGSIEFLADSTPFKSFHDTWTDVSVTVDGGGELTIDPFDSIDAFFTFIHISGGASAPFGTSPGLEADINAPGTDIKWIVSNDPNYDEYDVYWGPAVDNLSLLGTVPLGDPNVMPVTVDPLPIETTYFSKIVARDTDEIGAGHPFLGLDNLSSFIWEWSTRGQICYTPVDGDLNADCMVDADDLEIMALEWLQCNRVPNCDD